MCQKCFKTLFSCFRMSFSCFRTSFPVLERPFLFQSILYLFQNVLFCFVPFCPASCPGFWLSRPVPSQILAVLTRSVPSLGKIFSMSCCPFVPGQQWNFCPVVPKSFTVPSRWKRQSLCTYLLEVTSVSPYIMVISFLTHCKHFGMNLLLYLQVYQR